MDIGTLTGHIEIEDELSKRLDIIADEVGDFAKEFDGAMGAVAVSVGVAVVAIGSMAATIIKLGNTGSEVNDIADTFERFSGSATNAAESLNKMREGTKGVITDFELMKDANRLLAAGVQVTSDELGTLAKTASVLADQGLGSVEENMNQLNQAMLTGRTRAIELKLGKIDLRKAEIDFAKSLGTTRDQLNEEGKAQAHRIALIELANKRVSEAGEIHKSFADIMTGAVVKIKNWGNELAGAVAKSPAVMSALNAIGDAISKTFGTTGETISETLLKGIDTFASGVEKYGPILIDFFGSIRDTAVKYWPYVVEFFSKIKNAAMDLWDWLKELNERYHITETVVEVATQAWEFLKEAIHLVEEAIKDLKDAWESMPEWLQKIAVTGAAAGVGLVLAGKGIEKATEEAHGVGPALHEASEGIHEYGGAFYYLNHVIDELTKKDIREWIKLGWEGIKGVFEDFKGSIGSLVGYVTTAVTTIGEILLSVPGLVVLMVTGILAAGRYLTGSWDFILDPIKLTWQVVKDLTTAIVYLAEEGFKTLIDWGHAAWDGLKGLFNIFVDLVDEVAKFLGLGMPLTQFFIDMGKGMEDAKKGAGEVLKMFEEGSGFGRFLRGVQELHDFVEKIRKEREASRPVTPTVTTEEAFAISPEVMVGGAEGGNAPDRGKYVQSLQEKVDALLASLRKAPEDMRVFQAAFKQLTPQDFALPELVEQLIPKIDKLAELSGGELDPAMKRVYESVRLNAQAMADDGYNVLTLKGVTLEHIEALKKQGLSEAQIARHYEVTAKAVRDYTQVLTEHRQATDELTKSQDALNEAQRAYDLKGAKLEADAAQIALKQQFDAGIIAAEDFARKRVAIEEDYQATRVKLEQEGVTATEGMALRDLTKRYNEGKIAAEDYVAEITAIHDKSAQQRLTIDQNEAERRLKITQDSLNQLAAMQRQYVDETYKRTHTALENQIYDIEKWAKETKAAVAASYDPTVAVAYFALINRLEKQRKADLLRDTEALRSNSIQSLQDVANKAQTTYQDMLEDSSNYSMKTKIHFRDLAIAAADAANQTEHEWRTALESIPETLKSAFEGGGDIAGALKSLAVTFAEVFSKKLAEAIKAAIISKTFSDEVMGTLIPGKFSKLTGETLALSAGAGILSGAAAAASGGSAKQQLGTVATTGLMVGETAKLAGATTAASIALAAWTAGIGAAVVGAVLWIKHLHAARNEAIKFATEQFGGFDNLRKEMLKLGDEGEAMWKRLTQGDLSKKQVQALEKQITESLQKLNADVEKYGLSWDDVGDAQTKARKSADELTASYTRLTKAGFASDKVIDAMSTDLNKYIVDSIKAGVKIPQAMEPILQSLIKQKKLSQEAANALLGIGTVGGPSFDQVKEAADRYGISLDALGPKVAQLEIDSTAATLVDDWNTLTSVTSDWGAIMDGMAPKVQDMIDKALKFGVQLPATMKPMIDAMIKAGKLTDETGNKLTDLSQLPFAADLSEMFETLMGKLDELIDKITNGVGGALAGIGNTTVSPKIKPEYIPPEMPEGQTGPAMATGGVVYAAQGATIPKPQGTDTVPAMLTPGEGVVTTSGMETLTAAGLEALNRGEIGRAVAAIMSSAKSDVGALAEAIARLKNQQAEAIRATFKLVDGYKSQGDAIDDTKDATLAAVRGQDVIEKSTTDLMDVFKASGQTYERVGGVLVKSQDGVQTAIDGSTMKADDFHSHIKLLGGAASDVAATFGDSFNGQAGIKGSIEGSKGTVIDFRSHVQGVGTDATNAATVTATAAGDMSQSYDEAGTHAVDLQNSVHGIWDENYKLPGSLDTRSWEVWSQLIMGFISNVIAQLDLLIQKLDKASSTASTMPAPSAPTAPTTPAPPTGPVIISKPAPPPSTTTPGPIPGGTTPGPTRSGYYTFGGAQAEGGDYYVDEPTLFVAGEKGPERASFIPSGKPQRAEQAAPVTNTINIHIDHPTVDSSQRVDEMVDKLSKKLPKVLKQGGQTLDDWAQVHRILKRKVG